jgi:hypothetical protein
MDIQTYSEGLQRKLAEFENTSSEDPLSQTAKVLSFVNQLLKDLRQFTESYRFQDDAEEINFFKNLKPILLSQYYYYKKKISIQVFDSFRDRKSRIENYEKLLRKMHFFIRSNREFYEYCISGSSNLDHIYFKRNQFSTVADANHDENVGTGFDGKLAKILANELIKDYVGECIAILDKGKGASAESTLRWTAPKTDLVELIYALQEVGAFNNSSSDVRTIVQAFETSFNTDLGNYYRTFLGIRTRKTGQTAFLEQLKQRLIQRMNEMDDR